MRFHSLPGSKRYPEDESEYATVLKRHNTVLDELFGAGDVHVVTSGWSTSPTPPLRSTEDVRLHPQGKLWTSILTDDDPDPELRLYTHLYVSQTQWRRGCIDPLLRAVADDRTAGVIITDTDLRRLYHPYDGGADVILTTSAERDSLRERHRSWLSAHLSGL